MAAGKADAVVVSEWTFLYEQLRGDLARFLADVKKNPGWQEATSL